MKLSAWINAWGPTMGGIMLVIAALILWERKSELPDHYEPMTVEEADIKIAELSVNLDTLTFAAKDSVYNAAIRNIPYNWDQRCFPPSMDTETSQVWDRTWWKKIKESYKNHIWATGEKHEYDGLSTMEVCTIRKLKKEQE